MFRNVLDIYQRMSIFSTVRY